MKIRINFDFFNEILNDIRNFYYQFKKTEKRNDISTWMEEVKFEEKKK